MSQRGPGVASRTASGLPDHPSCRLPGEAASWTALKARFPWPAARPAVGAIEWSLDFGGRDLIIGALADRPLRLVLEIGVFLGGSVRQWLQAADDVLVVAVDPWSDLSHRPPYGSFAERHPLGRRHAAQLFVPNGLYDSFVSSMWDVRERIVPVRGKAKDVLPTLHALGLRPDLIYIDGDKTGDELPLCERLFPSALIGGDDWMWQDGSTFPIRRPAIELARRQGRMLKHIDNTWLIDDRPWNWRQRRCWVAHLPSTMRHRLDAIRQRLSGLSSSGEPARTRR